MNANQGSEGNHQSEKEANDKSGSPSHRVTADKGNLGQWQRPASQQQGRPPQRSDSVQRGRGSRHLSADEDMDDDTGLSNRGNQQSAEDIDEGARQSRQSNVGRRDDGTPD